MGPLLLSRPATVPRQAQRSDTLCNQQVRCSSHPTSSNLPFRHTSELGGIPEWPKGADCKSVVSDFGGSNPPSPTKKESHMRLFLFLYHKHSGEAFPPRRVFLFSLFSFFF